MNYILLISLIGIFILILLLSKEYRINYVATFLLTIIIIYFIAFPNLIIDSAKNGAILFFNNLFPTLFPFLIVTELLIHYGGVNIYSKLIGPFLCKPLKLPKQCSFTLVVSFLCGYPLGAKYSCHLYEENLIETSTFRRLLNIASNGSPLFIIGSVSTSMLNLPSAGIYLLLSNYISCILMAFILKPTDSKIIQVKDSSFKTDNFGSILKISLDNSLSTALSVGSYIIMFSILISILKNTYMFQCIINFLCNILFFLPNEAVKGLTLGMFEMTNGCYILSSASISLKLKLSMISFLCAFSGLSIICQIHSFVYKFKDISIARYIFRKFIQGILSFLLTYCTLSLVSLDVYTMNSSMCTPYWVAFLPILILIILSIILSKLFNLFHMS
ncbi:sporulation integral membrane protein YlbJ [Clostridium frigidicarnis]|uniref:Sporulation integral membrane protein YlbJ n=1 Tax=Clostridium frigidicarnis TaxID=84698 RepID=A0A1I0ZN54_9CLOT|nr:sporulation integral membrane protein YlbJ [Clostridium frigidicarnis]SFB27065.1 sporulation integral membrane protein YlbJ [Clostridium frigidicarnis]